MRSTAIVYRFTDFMPNCITVHRYATVLSTAQMEGPWIPAIRRLMAAKGLTQKDLSEKSGVRPNTLSDLLNGGNTKADTLMEIARGLDVPMWALFCTDHEYALFTHSTKQDDAATQEAKRIEASAETVLERLKPMVIAALKGEEPAAPVTPKVVAKARKAGR